jgi:hypothetical protein
MRRPAVIDRRGLSGDLPDLARLDAAETRLEALVIRGEVEDASGLEHGEGSLDERRMIALDVERGR